MEKVETKATGSGGTTPSVLHVLRISILYFTYPSTGVCTANSTSSVLPRGQAQCALDLFKTSRPHRQSEAKAELSGAHTGLFLVWEGFQVVRSRESRK